MLDPDLGLPASRNGEIGLVGVWGVLFISHPVYGILLCQPKQIKINISPVISFFESVKQLII